MKDTADLEGVLTTPEQSLEFIATGIDPLAPAFGNIHGEYGAKGPRRWLEFDRLAKVKEAVGDKVKIVLHGTNALIRNCYRNV